MTYGKKKFTMIECINIVQYSCENTQGGSFFDFHLKRMSIDAERICRNNIFDIERKKKKEVLIWELK